MRPGGMPWLKWIIWVLLLTLGLWADATWATEPVPTSNGIYDTHLSPLIQYLKANFSRATWDLSMRWVNFLILVAIIVKYARRPVIGFLKGKQIETARTIELIDAEQRLAEKKVKEGQIKLQASHKRLELLRARIVSEGKRQKAQMIADAQKESRIMLESARTRVDGQIREAYQTIRVELIETATEKATAKLPQMMAAKDHAHLIDLWFEDVRH